MENSKDKPNQKIVGYRLKSSIDRRMVDGILKTAMPIWNDEDKSVYFIRGHIAGSSVAKMKELQVLNLWFTPIYESEEVKSNWIKEHHLKFYYEKGIMSDEPKQAVCEHLKDVGCIKDVCTCNTDSKQETLEEAAKRMLANNIDGLRDALQDDDLFFFYKGVIEEFGKVMAKWQAERDKEIIDSLSNTLNKIGQNNISNLFNKKK